MEKVLYINGERYGQLGKPVFKDSSGKQLYVGDIVCTIGTQMPDINVVADDFIYGWANSTRGGNLDTVQAYKIINYTQIEDLNEKILDTMGVNIKIKTLKREMTISEIEKELGYPIKIIKD